MKEVNTMISFKPFTEEDFITIADNRLNEEIFNCPYCGYKIRVTEAYINERQREDFNLMIKHYNDMINQINEAIFEIYGEDIRLKLLSKKLSEIQKNFAKPSLQLVKGG